MMTPDDSDRMRIIDAMWIDIDEGESPIAVGAVLEFVGTAPDLTSVEQRIAKMLPEAPRLHQRLQFSRGGRRQPTWVSTHVNVADHVQGVAVSDLAAGISELLARPMRRDRPLWDVTIFSGYAAGRWALAWRLHHSVADGEGATMLVGRALDMSADGGMTMTEWLLGKSEAAWLGQAGSDAGSAAGSGLRERLSQAAGSWGRTITAASSAIRPTLRSLLRLVPGVPTPVSGHPSRGRDWRCERVPLAQVKAAGRAHGATVNDVLLAAVANGFRELLIANDQMGPGRVVRAVMPVSTRRPGDSRANNQVTMIPVELPVVADHARDRLAAVVHQTQQGKASMLPQLISVLQGVADTLVPAALFEALVTRGGWTVGLVADTLVTNVRGPDVPVYFLGQEVRYLSAIIPVGAAMRTVVGINSYNGWIHVSVTGDAEHARDNQVLLEGIRQGINDLLTGDSTTPETRW